jgi:hypothetical protein
MSPSGGINLTRRTTALALKRDPRIKTLVPRVGIHIDVLAVQKMRILVFFVFIPPHVALPVFINDADTSGGGGGILRVII